MIYLGTYDMPIYHFTKCLIKDDLRYMVIGWNEREEIEIPKEAEDTWEEIFNKYCDKTSNNDTDTYYALINEIDYLKRRFNILEVLVKELNENNRETFGWEIEQWGFIVNKDKLIKDQIKSFERQFRIAKQDIDLKEDELEKMMKETDNGEPMNLYKKKIKLERITGLKIDLKTTVIDEWIEILSEADEISEFNKRELAKHGN